MLKKAKTETISVVKDSLHEARGHEWKEFQSDRRAAAGCRVVEINFMARHQRLLGNILHLGYLKMLEGNASNAKPSDSDMVYVKGFDEYPALLLIPAGAHYDQL